jgi:hypothetical protein
MEGRLQHAEKTIASGAEIQQPVRPDSSDLETTIAYLEWRMQVATAPTPRARRSVKRKASVAEPHGDGRAIDAARKTQQAEDLPPLCARPKRKPPPPCKRIRWNYSAWKIKERALQQPLGRSAWPNPNKP